MRRRLNPEKRPVSYERVEEVANIVFARAEALGISIALAGGNAMAVYGSPRFTSDLDFVADRYDSGLVDEEEGILTFGGYAGFVDGVPVDIIVWQDPEDYIELFEDALFRAQVIEGFKVVRPEHLVVMKMIAKRDKDQGDVEHLVCSGAIDPKKTRKLVKKFLGEYAADDFDMTVEFCKHMPDMKRRRRR